MHNKQTLLLLGFLKPFPVILHRGWCCVPVEPTRARDIASVMTRRSNVSNFRTSVGGKVASEYAFQEAAATSVLDTLEKSWQTIIDEHNASLERMVDT